MRKLGVGILVLLILLSGCSTEKEDDTSKNEENDTNDISSSHTYGLLKHLKKTNYEIVGNIQYSDELETLNPQYETFLETNIHANILKGRYYYQYNEDIDFSEEYFHTYPILEENGYSGISTINTIYEQLYEENKTSLQKDYITLGSMWDMFYEFLKNEKIPNKNSSTFHGYGYSTVSVEYTEPYVNLIFFHSFYGGGAHPIYGYSTNSYDMRNGELIELEDLFSNFDKNKGELQTLLQVEVEGTLHSPELIKLDSWYNENTGKYQHAFTITNGGIQFLFGNYEIGSYAEGMPIITLKYSDIKQYLSEEFIESLEFEI